MGGAKVWAEDAKITIDASKIDGFTNFYKQYSWADGEISGKCYAYKNSSNMQFNENPYVYNVSEVPGRIKSVTITKGGGTARSWSVYMAGKSLTSKNYQSEGTQIGNSQTVRSNYTWKVPEGSDYNYFYITKGSNSTQISSIVITYEVRSTPALKTSLSILDFGAVENNTSKDLAFKLSGTKLTADATLSVDGEYFTVAPTTVAQTDGTIAETDVTVSYKPTAVGSHTATLTISSTGAKDKTITLTGTSANAYNVAWNVNGKAYSEGTPTTKVVDGEKVTVLPTTPSDVNGKVFVGWTNSEIAAEQNDAPSVLFTSVDDAPVVLHNITYYAVFAKAGGKVVEAETEDTKFDNSYKEYCGVNNGLKNVGNGIKKNKIWDALSNEVVKLKVYHVSNGEADVLTLALINENGKVVTSKDIETTELGNSTKAAGYSAYVELQANSSVTGYSVTLKTLNSYGTSVGKVTREVVEGTSGYCTTVAAAAEPTYTKQTPLTFRAEDNGYYATFSNDKVTFITSDYSEAYKIVVSAGNIVKTKFEEVAADINGKTVKGFYIPANTGILLYSIAETADYYTVENKTVDALADGTNMLKPAPVAGGIFTAEPGKVYYKLAYNDYTAKTGLGFYWGAGEGGAFYVKAGTAYLAVPKAKAAGAKGFAFNGEATGIEGVNANVENAKAIYNLNGQRVASMAKPGLYIVNGKKVVRK